MATLIGTPQVRAAFDQHIYPAGIDLARSTCDRAFGDWQALSGASFRAGQPVMLDANRFVTLYTGASRILGVAKWDKITTKRTVIVDAPITFTASNQTKNLLPNIVTGSLQVRTAALGAGSAYTITTDYTLNLVNGTITQVSGGAPIPLNTVVYVSYARTLTEAELVYEGKNFWQSLDYATQENGRITVVQPPATIYTTEFDPSAVYAYGAAVYANTTSSLFTSASSGGTICGQIVGVPSNGDPYLGIDFSGQVS